MGKWETSEGFFVKLGPESGLIVLQPASLCVVDVFYSIKRQLL